VGVLSDPCESDIHRFRLKFTPNLPDAPRRVAVAIEKVVSGDPGLVNQPLEKILAKTCRMSSRKSNVFVEMKYLDTAPVDIGRAGERIQKLKLRGSGSRDDACFSMITDCAAQRLRGVIGSRAT